MILRRPGSDDTDIMEPILPTHITQQTLIHCALLKLRFILNFALTEATPIILAILSLRLPVHWRFIYCLRQSTFLPWDPFRSAIACNISLFKYFDEFMVAVTGDAASVAYGGGVGGRGSGRVAEPRRRRFGSASAARVDCLSKETERASAGIK